jgi:hypothetical protein
MIRKTMAAVAVAGVLMLGGAPAAFAQSAGADDSNYTPRTPTQPGLAGSTATSECNGDVPWITFRIVMADPDGVARSHEARLVLTDGTHTYTRDLGPLVNNTLSGRTLWPGAKVDSRGAGIAWPGWEVVGGVQTQTGGNFGWTRGRITATLTVNPELVVPLSYPVATSGCAAPKAVSSAAILPRILPATGLSVSRGPIVIGGGMVLLVGAGLLLARRLRRS